MEIQIRDRNKKGMLASLAELLNTVVRDGILDIPSPKGEGYLAGVIVNEHVQVMIERYRLSADLKVERLAAPGDDETVILFFNNPVLPFSAGASIPDATLCSSGVSEEIVPAMNERNSVTIAIRKAFLSGLFGEDDYGYLHTILSQTGPFALNFEVSSDMLRALEAMVHSPYRGDLKRAFFLSKTLELLCLAVPALRFRDEIKTSLHLLDIKAVYAIQREFRQHPDKTPFVPELAAAHHMSEVKLRRIFKKITGKGIFEYYQFIRMTEAAKLLGEHLSVSEVGYRLGFTNLSHFARAFKKHFGCNPKKYRKK